VLAGIVNTPVFGRRGRLLTTPGYHPDARLLYCPAPGFEVPAIAERPSAEELSAARALICEDLFGEFPFVSRAEQAHAVALLLLGFLRPMIDGPTPLHLIEKPEAGTGATLMVDAIATILTGTAASVMTEASDDEEWRKRVTAKLRQIPSIVLIDNLRQKLDSSAVAAALTAPFWEDRILGVSEMARVPIRCVWIATGNNPEFSNEMARRIVRIRLDAHVERPWQREGFRHPDLMIWVRANRARLVSACLTLCQTWIAAGRPRGTRTIGSYENWAQVLGGLLQVAGVEGFLGNIEELMEASDADGAVWRSLVSAWWDRFGTAEVGTNDLYETALGCEPPLQLGSGNDRSQRIRLGKALGRLRDRVFQLKRVSVRAEMCGILHSAQRWRLAIDEKTDTEKHSQHSPTVNVSGNVGNVGECLKTNIPREISNDTSGMDGVGECWECFSDPYACADARAPAIEHPEKHSQHPQHSPNPGKPPGSDGECAGECRPRHPPIPNPPEWLKEVLLCPRSSIQSRSGNPTPPARLALGHPAKPDDNGQLRQEPSRRRPDHDYPLNGDHHGFDDSDSACSRNKPHSGTIVRHRARHDPRARSRHDDWLGVAIGGRRHPQRYGFVPAEPLRRRRRSLPAVPCLARQRGQQCRGHRCHPLRRNQETSGH
jgi:putative DNA primase/helicase